jgi:hypothetical protein
MTISKYIYLSAKAGRDYEVFSTDASAANMRAGTGTLSCSGEQYHRVGLNYDGSYDNNYYICSLNLAMLPAELDYSAVTLYFWLNDPAPAQVWTINVRAIAADANPISPTSDWLTPSESAAKTLIASRSTSGLDQYTNYAFTMSMNLADFKALAVDNRITFYLVSSRYEASDTPTTDETLYFTEVYARFTVSSPRYAIYYCDNRSAIQSGYNVASGATWASVRDASSGTWHDSYGRLDATLTGGLYYSSQTQLKFTWSQGSEGSNFVGYPGRAIKSATLYCPFYASSLASAYDSANRGLLLFSNTFSTASSGFKSKATLLASHILYADMCTYADLNARSTTVSNRNSVASFNLNAAGIAAIQESLATGSFECRLVPSDLYYDRAPTGFGSANAAIGYIYTDNYQESASYSALTFRVMPYLIIEYEDVPPFHGAHF